MEADNGNDRKPPPKQRKPNPIPSVDGTDQKSQVLNTPRLIGILAKDVVMYMFKFLTVNAVFVLLSTSKEGLLSSYAKDFLKKVKEVVITENNYGSISLYCENATKFYAAYMSTDGINDVSNVLMDKLDSITELHFHGTMIQNDTYPAHEICDHMRQNRLPKLKSLSFRDTYMIEAYEDFIGDFANLHGQQLTSFSCDHNMRCSALRNFFGSNIQRLRVGVVNWEGKSLNAIKNENALPALTDLTMVVDQGNIHSVNSFTGVKTMLLIHDKFVTLDMSILETKLPNLTSFSFMGTPDGVTNSQGFSECCENLTFLCWGGIIWGFKTQTSVCLSFLRSCKKLRTLCWPSHLPIKELYNVGFVSKKMRVLEVQGVGGDVKLLGEVFPNIKVFSLSTLKTSLKPFEETCWDLDELYLQRWHGEYAFRYWKPLEQTGFSPKLRKITIYGDKRNAKARQEEVRDFAAGRPECLICILDPRSAPKPNRGGYFSGIIGCYFWNK